MNFLAVDTSGKRLSVVACKDGEFVLSDLPDCALQHSVRLMDEVDGAFSRANLTPAECDFFAAVVGAGSFTGIRIGIATVKGLCVAAGKPALSITSFDCIAYAEEKSSALCLVDAGHGYYYACGYRQGEISLAPCYIAEERVKALVAEGYEPLSSEPLAVPTTVVDACIGLKNAVMKRAGEERGAEALTALYIRKSSAEENLR